MKRYHPREVVTKALMNQVGSSLNLRGVLVLPAEGITNSGDVHFNVLDADQAAFGKQVWSYRIEPLGTESEPKVTFNRSRDMSNPKRLVIRGNAGVLNALSAVRSKPKIVGGVPSVSGTWPWMTAIYYRNCTPDQCQFCGGSLIDSNWVLTAAHCAAAVGNTPIDVFLGGIDLAGAGTKISVDQVIVHEDFDPNTLDNDIALLHLSKPASIKPIRLIDAGDPDELTSPDSLAKIIGWGATSEGGPGSQLLLETEVSIITQAAANQALSPFGSSITDNMIPALVAGGGKDTCQGDSGGPFVVQDLDGKWVLAGVTSWGIGCARPNLPGIYSRISNYRDWIQQNTGGIGEPEPVPSSVEVDERDDMIVVNIRKGNKPVQINLS